MIVFTVCSRSMIALAMVLHEALVRHHPECRLYVAIPDGVDGLDIASLPFGVLRPSEVGLPDLEGMATRYSDVEFRASLKPFVFQLLFDRHPGEGVLYLDSDTMILSRFDELVQLVSDGAECVLVPAITEPAEHAEIDDGQFLRYGVYDLGFIWLANQPAVRRIVWWWARRLESQCVVDPDADLYLDQRWVDLFPALIDQIRILRHPGYGVAYWNLAQRRLRLIDGRWFVNGLPLRIVHFRGCDLDDDAVFSRYSTLYDMGSTGPIADLLRGFRSALKQHRNAIARG